MKPRGTQRGTLERRNLSWVLRYRRPVAEHESGAIDYRSTSTVLGSSSMSKSEARRLADRLLAAVNGAGAPHIPADMTLATFVDTVFMPERAPELRPAGKAHYEYILDKHLKPSLGAQRLDAIDPVKLRLLLALKARAGYSRSTVDHCRRVLSAVYEHARRRGYWTGDAPTRAVTSPGREPTPRGALTPEQVAGILNNIAPRYRPLITLLATTGLRIGEALGLKWGRVNLAPEPAVKDGVLLPRQSLLVAQTYSRGNWGPVKTSRSRRIVPLTSYGVEALRAMYDALPMVPSLNAPIFAGRTGQPWDSHNLAADHLKPAALAAGVPEASFHWFRHTAASLPGLDMVGRMALLGHASPSVTDMYMHTTPATIEVLRSALEAANFHPSTLIDEVGATPAPKTLPA